MSLSLSVSGVLYSCQYNAMALSCCIHWRHGCLAITAASSSSSSSSSRRLRPLGSPPSPGRSPVSRWTIFFASEFRCLYNVFCNRSAPKLSYKQLVVGLYFIGCTIANSEMPTVIQPYILPTYQAYIRGLFTVGFFISDLFSSDSQLAAQFTRKNIHHR